MMQNEEFIAELRNDREFMSSLAEEEDEFYSSSGSSTKRYYNQSAATAKIMDEAVFREKLKNMGKKSKKKFTQVSSYEYLRCEVS